MFVLVPPVPVPPPMLLPFFPETIDVIRHEVCSPSNRWLVPLCVTTPIRKRRDSFLGFVKVEHLAVLNTLSDFDAAF